jgi:hypothetical protein
MRKERFAVRRFLAAMTAFALVAGFAGLASVGQGTAQAAPITIEGVATGAEENPPVNSPGSVRVRFVIDLDAKTIQYAATVNGLSQDQVVAAHLHRGAKGSNGPIVINLSLVPFTQISGTVTLTDDQLADLKAGNLYFNAHSKDNPGGFARFQLVLPASAQPAPTSAPSTGITAPSTGDAGLMDRNADSSSDWLPFAALAAFGVAGTGAFALARRRAR